MALLSYNLIEEILGVAESYAEQEKARLNRLSEDGQPPAAMRSHAPARRRNTQAHPQADD